MPTVTTTTQSKQPHVINKQDLQNLIAKNLFISVFARIFNLLTRFLIPPLVLSFVSLHEYGLWAISFVIISYFNLGEFGIANVYIRYVAAYHATHEIEKINGLVSTGVTLVTTISFVFLLLSWYVIPLLIEQQVFKISPNHHATALILFYGTVTIFLISISFNVFAHILNGLQKIAQTSLVMIFCLMIEMSALVIFLFQGFGVLSLLYAFVIRTIVSILIYFFLCHHFIPGFSIGLTHFDRSYFQLFYRFGAIIQLQSIFGLILRTIDKIIASTMLSMKATALLDLGSKIPVMSNSISGSMNAVFLPAMSYAYSQQRQEEVFDMYIRGSRTISLFMGFLMGFLTAFSVPLTVAWLGTDEKFQIVAVIMAIFTFSRQLHALTGMGTAYFKGIEKPSYTLIYPGMRLIFVGLIASIIFYFFEITIFNIATIIVLSTILTAIFFIIYVNHFLRVSQSSYLTQVILPGIVPYGIGCLLLWLTQPWLTVAMTDRWYAAGFILVSGMIYSILTLSTIYWGIFTSLEKNFLHQRIQKIMKK